MNPHCTVVVNIGLHTIHSLYNKTIIIHMNILLEYIGVLHLDFNV